VIPTIPGREDLLARAVASVKDQTLPPAELRIQVDRDRRGAAWCRNEALARVDTAFVAWLDDDDTLLPDHVQTLVDGHNETGADLVFSYAEFIGGRDPLACCHNGVLTAEPINVPFGFQQRDHLDSRRGTLCPWCGCQRGNVIPVTNLVRTEAIRAVGGFPEPHSMPDVAMSGDCEDYLLLCRLLDAGAKFYHVCGVRTWQYHFHDEPGTGNTGGRGAHRMHELDSPPLPT
jgi:glycosyltransferase involved in cell wall biosynthesis